MRGDGPVWPIQRPLNPTLLKTYKDCPRKVLLQQIERRSAPFLASLPMELGKVAHSLLAESARALRDGQPLASGDALFAETFRRLKKPWFPSKEAHEFHTCEVVDWVTYGLSHLDRSATFLAIEEEQEREFPWTPGVRLRMETRTDLILLRTRDDGTPFVEIIDYKTGSKDYPDDIPPVAMRFAYTPRFRQLFPDPLAMPMQFTYVWLKHRETLEIPLTPDYCTASWGAVQRLIGALVNERQWPEQPSILCNYCKYNGNACSAFAGWQREHPRSHGLGDDGDE